LASDTDFVDPRDLGPAPPVECPVAVDASRGVGYYYHCADWNARRDVSEIRGAKLAEGTSESVFRLGLNKWALWLCRYLPRTNAVAALIATEMPRRADGGIVIQHQLGMFDVATGQSLLTPLPRDCFFPLAIDPDGEQVLFHGAEGFQIIEFSGKRRWKLGGRGLPSGRGGAFHPIEPGCLALGGGGLVLVRASGEFELIHQRGLNPVWSPCGSDLYYAESSSDLWRWDPGTKTRQRLLEVAGNPHTEVNRARPLALTPDGRYGALMLTRRIRRASLDQAAHPETKKVWAEWRAICILDFEANEVWRTAGEGPVTWG